MKSYGGNTGKGHRRWPVLLLVCAAEFAVVGALAVVAIALPSIGEDLGFSRSGLQWVISAYVLAFGGFLLPAGRAADLLGRRRVFVAGLALFSGASLVCALSGSARPSSPRPLLPSLRPPSPRAEDAAGPWASGRPPRRAGAPRAGSWAASSPR